MGEVLTVEVRQAGMSGIGSRRFTTTRIVAGATYGDDDACPKVGAFVAAVCCCRSRP